MNLDYQNEMAISDCEYHWLYGEPDYGVVEEEEEKENRWDLSEYLELSILVKYSSLYPRYYDVKTDNKESISDYAIYELGEEGVKEIIRRELRQARSMGIKGKLTIEQINLCLENELRKAKESGYPLRMEEYLKENDEIFYIQYVKKNY